MFYLFFVNFLFALTYPLIDFVTNYSSIFTLLFFRMIISGIILLTFQFFRNSKNVILEKRDFFQIFLISIFNIFFTFLAETYAIKNISGIEVSILYLLSPIISLIIGDFFFGEKIEKKRLILLVLVLPIIFLNFLRQENSLFFTFNFKYYLFLIMSIVGSILSWHKIKKFLKRYSILTINGYSFLISGFLFFLFGKIFDNKFLIVKNNFKFSCGLLLLIIIGNIFGYNLYERLLKKYSMNTIVFSWFLSPFYLFFINYLFFGLNPKIENLIVFFIVFFSLNLFYFLEKKEQKNKG